MGLLVQLKKCGYVDDANKLQYNDIRDVVNPDDLSWYDIFMENNLGFVAGFITEDININDTTVREFENKHWED